MCTTVTCKHATFSCKHADIDLIILKKIRLFDVEIGEAYLHLPKAEAHIKMYV